MVMVAYICDYVLKTIESYTLNGCIVWRQLYLNKTFFKFKILYWSIVDLQCFVCS